MSAVRLDLLSDDDLDAHRARFGSAALDAHELLLEAAEARLAEIERAAREALEDRIEHRPILSVVVCRSCGAFEVARTSRPWVIDRAMLKSGLGERDVLAIVELPAEAGLDDGALDRLAGEKLRELHGLVGDDVDLACVRERYG